MDAGTLRTGGSFLDQGAHHRSASRERMGCFLWECALASDEGLVIEDSRIVLQGKTPGTVTAETMALNIQPWAWLTSAFELDHALLKNGRFEMPLVRTGLRHG